jgi:hypothetical protein
VYLAPLVEELQQLWNGFLAYDVLKELGFRTFRLMAILLWTIHDFPGYGTIADVAHQRYVACLVYGPSFRGEHSFCEQSANYKFANVYNHNKINVNTFKKSSYHFNHPWSNKNG